MTLPNLNPTIVHAAAQVSVDDVRTAYYRQAPQLAWIREFRSQPKRLIVANDADGTVASVDFEVFDDGQITCSSPVPVRVEYVEQDDDAEKVAASRMVYASRDESRPTVAARLDVQAHATHDQRTHGNRYRGGQLVSGPGLPTRDGERDSAPPKSVQDLADNPDAHLDSFVTVLWSTTRRDWEALTDSQKDSLAELSERLERDGPPNVRQVSDACQKLRRWETDRQRRTNPLRRDVRAASVSDRPWSDFDESDYTGAVAPRHPARPRTRAWGRGHKAALREAAPAAVPPWCRHLRLAILLRS